MRVVINGFDITDYIAFQGLKWSRNDVDGSNAGRNLAGTMIRDRVATKIRWDISCRPLTSEEHTNLMNAILPEFVSVSISDPLYGDHSSVMYSNNHSSSYCIKYKNGVEYWHDISFPLIER